MRIVCSGNLVRYPAGGHSWHHAQYLVGLLALGVQVTFVEEAGWPSSCYDARADEMTDDPSWGLQYFQALLALLDVDLPWCFRALDGATFGMTAEELADSFAEADCYLSLSNMNSFPEASLVRRRALVDTDPVFTQIGAHGLEDPATYDVRFTYGENFGRPGCTIPEDGLTWLPTRQPVAVQLWDVTPGDPSAALTTVTNWSAYGDHTHDGVVYGQKEREFSRILDLPSRTTTPLEVALGGGDDVRSRLESHGWRVSDAGRHTRTPSLYQDYIRASLGELSVAKHAYVSTCSGWFSDRTTGYLASGRPAVVQDTGFGQFLPIGEGLLAFTDLAGAVLAVQQLSQDYERHCAAARAVVEEHFEARRVLTRLLERVT